jgi:hypothetical protein
VLAARALCEFVTNPKEEEDSTSFLRATQHHLLHLYQLSIQLEWVDLPSDMEFDEFIHKTHFSETLQTLSLRLGTNRYYWSVFTPTDLRDDEPVCCDLLDDLGDIYQDLKKALVIYDLPIEYCKEHAIWQFKFDFETHWGNHCINALRGIHFFLKAGT